MEKETNNDLLRIENKILVSVSTMVGERIKFCRLNKFRGLYILINIIKIQ